MDTNIADAEHFQTSLELGETIKLKPNDYARDCVSKYDDGNISYSSHQDDAEGVFDSLEAAVPTETQLLYNCSAVADTNEVHEPDILPSINLAMKEKSTVSQSLSSDSLLRGWWTPWLWEIICIVTSFALLASAIAILCTYDGTSLQQWHSNLSLSAVVSILSTVSTFTLTGPVSSALGQLKWIRYSGKKRKLDEFRVLHDASRGIKGSLILLCRMRGGLIAAAGAALTILALVINPFLQQVIGYHSQVVLYQRAYLPIWSPALPSDDVPSALDTWHLNDMTADIWQAAIKPVITMFDVKPTCPTGNCTWPLYTTLGFCSSCTDVAPLLNSQTADNGSIWYHLPNGVGAWNMGNVSDPWELQYPTNRWQFPYNISGPWVNLTNTMQDLQGGSLVYKNSGGIALDVFYTTVSGPSAWECILQFCAQSRNASMENGIFTDVLISSWVNNSDAARGWLPGEEDPNEDFYFRLAEADELLYLDSTTATNIAFQLGEHVAGSVFYDPIILDPLQPQGKLGEWLTEPHDMVIFMSNVASGLTTTMRQRQYASMAYLVTSNRSTSWPGTSLDGNSSTYVTTHGGILDGYSTVYDLRIKIHWAWMTLPISILLLSVLFFATVVWQTYQHALHPWKQSILPVLYHGLSAVEAEGDWHELEEICAMEKRAREMVVVLQGEQRRKLVVV